MVIGLGIDLLEVERMRHALDAHGERLERRVFTDAEREQCSHRRDRVQALAARFAAKEACLKALGTGWGQGLSLRQIEVVRREGGKPELRLSGAAAERADRFGVKTIHVSLTHQPGTAAAVVLLEGT